MTELAQTKNTRQDFLDKKVRQSDIKSTKEKEIESLINSFIKE